MPRLASNVDTRDRQQSRYRDHHQTREPPTSPGHVGSPHLNPHIWGVPAAFCTAPVGPSMPVAGPGGYASPSACMGGLGGFMLPASDVLSASTRSGAGTMSTQNGSTWSSHESGTTNSGKSDSNSNSDSDPPLPANTAAQYEPPRSSAPATLMLRNLPNRAKKDRIEEHMHSLGFFDFELHLPIDSRTGVNKGYAFIRLPDEGTALKFITAVEKTQLPGGNSTSNKLLTAFFAANQGAPLALRPNRDRSPR